MTITKCDICKGEEHVTGVFVTFSGEYDGKHLETEARIDMCGDCKGRFVSVIKEHDNMVRSAKPDPRP